MPGTLDILFAALFAVLWPLWSHVVDWPRHVAAVAAGDPNARVRMYRRTVLEQWVLTAIAVVLTGIAGREPSTLGLDTPAGWRLWVGFAIPLVYGVIALVQVRALRSKPQTIAGIRAQVEPLRPIIPVTSRDWQAFAPLAVTAGICEELLFRGYLVWFLTPWLGLWGAAGLSVVLFGIAHGYQGPKFAVRAFLAGAVMGGLALLTGSVLPGMVLHAFVDLASGYAGFLALRDEPAAGATPEGGAVA